MDSKSKYKTKQKQELIDYLKTTAGGHITVNDVCGYFSDKGKPIGMTTVYRHMERLVDEGLVSKYIIDANTPACFEYMPEHEGHSHETCFHCKCECCGKLIHLHCDEVTGLGEHLLSEHGFKLDPHRTVFYGICNECTQD